MSSKTVRDTFETAFAALLPTLPLLDTDNDEPDRHSIPAEWATTDYIAYGEERKSLGETACWRETGTITVVVFVKAGTGSDQALVLADSVRTAFRAWKDSTVKLSIVEAVPADTGAASNGRWYAAAVNLNYIFDIYI
jgi:hypothetical protein